MPANHVAAISAWNELLGAGNVLTAETAQLRYGKDTGGAQRHIPAALIVSDAAQLPPILKIARQYQTPVHPISTGRNWGYGSSLPVQDGCVIIDLASMNRILHFDADFGVVTIEPGVTQGNLADYLRRENHPFLVPVTGAGPTCSVLSNALERGYGVTPYVDHFGAVTDIEAVLADGTIYKTALGEIGGDELARLFKWGIGPYSTGLFTQSGFGIVTRMSIALARRPDCVKACLFSLKDDALLEPAVLAIRSIVGRLGGTIGAINLMNRHRVLSMTTEYPRGQLNGDGVMPDSIVESLGRQYQIHPWMGFATLYGSQGMVRAAQAEIKNALRGIGSRIMFMTPGRAQQLSRLTRLIPGKTGAGLQGMTATLAKSLELVNGQPNETALPLAYWRNQIPAAENAPRNPALDGCGLKWYAPLVPMRPQNVRDYVRMVKEVTPRYGLEPLITLTTLSDKLFDSTVPLIFDTQVENAARRTQACYEELFETGRSRGWLPYRVGIETMSTLMGLTTHAKSFHERLLRDLDPDQILAPGKYR